MSDARHLSRLPHIFSGTECFQVTSLPWISASRSRQIHWGLVPGLRLRGCLVAHHPRYSLPIPSVLVPHGNTALHSAGTPTLTAGLLRAHYSHLCHPSHTISAHLSSLQFLRLFFLTLSLFLPPLTTKLIITTDPYPHTRWKLHHLVSACTYKALFLSGPSHLRKQCRFSTFTTTQGPLARHWWSYILSRYEHSSPPRTYPLERDSVTTMPCLFTAKS